MVDENSRKAAEEALSGLDEGSGEEPISDSMKVPTAEGQKVSELPELPADLDVPDPRELDGPTPLQTSSAYEILANFDIDYSEMTPNQAVEKAREIESLRANYAQVLSRGQTTDAIDRALAHTPEGHVGELVRDNEGDIQRMRALGFDVVSSPDADDPDADVGTHRAGDSSIRVGDLILMSIPEMSYKVMHKTRADLRARKRQASQRKQAEAQIQKEGLKTFSNL